jgi:ATP-dependent RNA helicase SUPV3L1/SUV3
MGKKKHSKINQKIRHFFGGDGFDEGIERVSTATLTELVQTLGILPDSLAKEDLIRILRREWSESDLELRAHILAFFKAENRIYPGSATKEPSKERQEHIAELIAQLDATPQEAKALEQAFIEIRSKKITLSKMESTLRHLRLGAKRDMIEHALEGVFDFENRLEFNASFEYRIFENRFNKIHTLKTPPLTYETLQNTSQEQIIQQLQTQIRTLIDERQQRINTFIARITRKPHRYLSADAIITLLKRIPPESDETYPPIDAHYLETILKARYEIASLHLSAHDVLLYLQRHYHLPYHEAPLPYEIELTLDRATLVRALWEEHDLDFDADIAQAQALTDKAFKAELDELMNTCHTHAKLLHLKEQELYESVYEELLPYLHQHLHISPKTARKVLFAFSKKIQKLLLKRQRQELLARSIRDFKNLFPLAREMRRRLVLHIGPTNSGKTYEAMQHLKAADTGYYLAPLRLLALEGYEELRESGIGASLITGEEQLLDDMASHISSTIEMLNFEVDVDVCVIDEVQMIDDRDRGWAWANAIIGAPAKTLIMTGSPNVKEAIIALAEYLGEPLEIIEFERKTPLHLLKSATPISQIQSGTAVIAFTRRDVLRLKQQLSRHFRVSVVYGNLSPEVRREEARRFRAGETEVLVATDAIAMGLNLPIQTILFSKAEKFDGEKQRELFPSEVHQISGRAGRYGMSEAGYVGALSPDVMRIVYKQYHKEARNVTVPFKVMANLEHIKLVGGILEETSLVAILEFFVSNMKFDGPFRATNLEGMLEAAAITDHYDLDLGTKFHLATAPLSSSSEYLMATYERYVQLLEKKESVTYVIPRYDEAYAQNMEALLLAEDHVKEISLYLWLSYRFSDYFLDVEKARATRGVINRFIENSLKQSHFVPRCRECSKPLPQGSQFAICQSCFRRLYRTPQKREEKPSGDRKRQR